MSLILKKTPDRPWSMRLTLPGPDLALTCQGARTGQEEIYQDTESNTEHLGVEEPHEVGEEDEGDPSSKEEHAEDMKSAADEDEDGVEGGDNEHEHEHEHVQLGLRRQMVKTTISKTTEKSKKSPRSQSSFHHRRS